MLPILLDTPERNMYLTDVNNCFQFRQEARTKWNLKLCRSNAIALINLCYRTLGRLETVVGFGEVFGLLVSESVNPTYLLAVNLKLGKKDLYLITANTCKLEFTSLVGRNVEVTC